MQLSSDILRRKGDTEDGKDALHEALVLLFGKHKGKRLDQVPNEYLGWLTMWEVTYHCCGDMANCEGECGRQVKIRCLTRKDCGRYCIRDNIVEQCSDCRNCESLTFLKRQTEVVTAARDATKRRRLCRECWKVMPAVGHNRTNGAGHSDWDERLLHKKCFRELVA